jgi:hypothetical protein
MVATVDAPANSASVASATPNTSRTWFSSTAPRRESPPSMKKSSCGPTRGRPSIAAQIAVSAVATGESGCAGVAAFRIVPGARCEPTHSARSGAAACLTPCAGAARRTRRAAASASAEPRANAREQVRSDEAGAGADDRRDDLAKPRVRHAERRGIGTLRHGAQRLSTFAGGSSPPR